MTGTGGPPIVMITGRAKSGTTWLSRLLDAHPAVLSWGEGRFFGRRLVSPKTGARSLETTLQQAEGLRAWLTTSVWTRGADPEEELVEMTGAVVRSVLRRRLDAAGKDVVVDKTPLPDEHYVRDLHRILPEAAVIQIIRDGRDVAISAIHHIWNRVARGIEVPDELLERRDAYRADPRAFLEGNRSIFPSPDWLDEAAVTWRDLLVSNRTDGRELLGNRYTEVRYEDLVERPVEELGRLAEFIGVDRSAAVLERCLAEASFERLSAGRTPGEEDSTSFYRKGVAGEWKAVFTEEDCRVFEGAAGELLADLGYEVSPQRTRAPSGAPSAAPRTTDELDWRAFDFVDLGCSGGGSIRHCQERFGARRGLGMDADPQKVDQARAAGFDAVVADVTALGASGEVRFVSMMDFLAHLSGLDEVESVIAAASELATDFLFIRHASFEGEEYLRELGLCQYWWRWRGHTAHLQISDYCGIFDKLGLGLQFVRYHEVVTDSNHPSVLTEDMPLDEGPFDPGRHRLKPYVPFAQPIWRFQDIFVALRPFDPQGWEWAEITHA